MIATLLDFCLRFTRFIVSGLLLLLLIAASYLIGYHNRPIPEAIRDQPLFKGVRYSRVVERDPALIYHVVKIDLNAAGLRFWTTPRDPIAGFDYAARTPSQFLDEFDLQVAINADFFDPWWAIGPLLYYPRPGDGVNARGLSISRGEVVTDGYVPSSAYRTLFITAANQAAFTPPQDMAYTAISGHAMVVVDGQFNHRLGNPNYLRRKHPRTAIALDRSRSTLMLFVVDGRQPNYSEGATMPQLAQIIIQHGGYNALNLDGGGSSALIIEGADGNPQPLSSAIHTRIPGRERPIANHFGVYALPLQE